MAAPMVEKVDVSYDELDNGSEADSEGSNDLDDDVELVLDEEVTQEKKGLADVFAKILHKNVPSNKQVILAKGKTDREIQKRKLEAQQVEENEKSAKQKTSHTEKRVESTELTRIEKVKLWENMNRSKPDPLKRDAERKLQRIATRGVVQLFNAVRKQQKTVEVELEQVGSSERRKDKVMEGMTRDKFLNILKGTSTTNVKMEPLGQETDTQAAKQIKTEDDDDSDNGSKKWNILRDDYMMGAKMKDWDNDDDDDDDSDNEPGPGDPDMSDSD